MKTFTISSIKTRRAIHRRIQRIRQWPIHGLPSRPRGQEDDLATHVAMNFLPPFETFSEGEKMPTLPVSAWVDLRQRL